MSIVSSFTPICELQLATVVPNPLVKNSSFTPICELQQQNAQKCKTVARIIMCTFKPYREYLQSFIKDLCTLSRFKDAEPP